MRDQQVTQTESLWLVACLFLGLGISAINNNYIATLGIVLAIGLAVLVIARMIRYS